MYLILNSDNEIKGVGVTTDPSLVSVYVDENADMFPFKGWSEAKICCYKVNVVDGIITMMTPYVDSRLIEHIDQLGQQIEEVKPYMDSQRAYIGDTQVQFNNVKGTHITAYCETDSGLSIPTTTERNSDKVTVSFNTLDEVATVTITVI